MDLPPSLDLTRDEEAEKALVDLAREWLDKGVRAEGVHASDLLMPLLAYWRRVDPQPVQDRETGLFLVGKILHAFVLGSQNGVVDLAVTDEGSVYDEELGLWYSPDKVTNGVPSEFKTNRGYNEPEKIGDLDTYLKQLLVYMATKKSTVGKLWVLYVNLRDEARKTHPQFRVYNVTITEEELKALRLEIKRERDALADALAAKDPSRLPLCPAWACHPSQCPHWRLCKPSGRYENPSYLQERRR